MLLRYLFFICILLQQVFTNLHLLPVTIILFLSLACFLYSVYRAMHFSAKRGLAIACRLSSCLTVRPSVTLVDCDHIGWNSSKIISPLVKVKVKS